MVIYLRTWNVDGALDNQWCCHKLQRATHLDIVPILAGKRVLRSLLEALLAFRKALVLYYMPSACDLVGSTPVV
jgi:hypothetical protein